MSSPSTNNAAYFELMPGKALDIQFSHPVNLRIKTSLIGYEVGKYIILKHPEPTRMQSYKDVLVEGNVAIVRYILEGTQGQCCAFKSSIKHVVKHPQKLIFLEFPQKIENRELRLHQRFVTHLPANILSIAEVDNDRTKISGIISDISAKGCGFSFKSDNAKLKVNKTAVNIQVSLGNNKNIEIPAHVCNSRYEQGKIFVGIQFQDAEQQVKQILEHLLIDNDF
ncbi:flagellar brake protein [Thalassotalea sp. M1531]|uniref:Flagellar brake protein n=2 Tax=Thalassotalea algicola TaxID=2716224 RepID=A0A7Y0LGP8_9GAMM|nr:flagellar brake protein [Thalassotalea algicola]